MSTSSTAKNLNLTNRHLIRDFLGGTISSMSKRQKLLMLLLVVAIITVITAVVVVSQHVRVKGVTLPSSPEFYADFIDEYNYSTLGFQYSKNEAIPVCFLMDVYNYVHQNYGHKLLTWRIISQSHNTVEYVFGFYDGSFLGRFSPKKRRLMKFITTYESSANCPKNTNELNVLFPPITVP